MEQTTKEIIQKINNHIPKGESIVFKSKGIVLLPERSDSKGFNLNNYSKKIEFFESKFSKIINNIAAVFIISCFTLLLISEHLNENPREDLITITIVCSIIILGISWNIYDEIQQNKIGRKLIISDLGVFLKGFRNFNWDEINYIALKKIPTGQADHANFYLVIVDKANSLFDYNISKFKGRSKYGIFHLVNSDYLRMRHILWVHLERKNLNVIREDN